MNSSTINKKHKSELAGLRGQRRGIGLRIFLAVVFVFFAWGGFIALSGNGHEAAESLEIARTEGELGEWEIDFLEKHQSYSEWLQKYGMGIEVSGFHTLTLSLYVSSVKLKSLVGEDSFVNHIYQAAHSALLRILFMIIACWRIWAIAVVIAGFYAFQYWKKYRGSNFLEQTGNGRLFYSGIRAGLEDLNERGVPGLLVTGLACADAVPSQVAKQSKLARTLSRYKAMNETNLALVAIILKHADWPAYVTTREEYNLLQSAFAGAPLGEKVEKILEYSLSLHESFKLKSNPPYPKKPIKSQADSKITLDEYIRELAEGMVRVLTPELEAQLAELESAQLATIILGLEAGAVLTNRKEADKWVRKSNFPELNARAIVHSIPHYSTEYSADERSVMRRALIFGSRSSVFAPVHFPIDLSVQARAARQWVELLLACPHELKSTADEVELVGLVTEANAIFAEEFFAKAIAGDPAITGELYATHSNLFLMPLGSVLKVLRTKIPLETIRRLEMLLTSVSQKEKLHSMSLDIQSENTDKPSHVLDEKVVTPFNHAEVKELCAKHGLSIDDVRDWSALRAVLNAFGWLARRVGDHTVPESSIILSVMKAETPNTQCNELGLFGKKGMVPFRATKLAAKWGKSWALRFKQVANASLAESMEDYERLLRGVPEPLESESNGSSVAVG